MARTPKQQRRLSIIIFIGGLLMFGLYLNNGYPWWLYPLPIFATLYGIHGYHQYRDAPMDGD